MNWFVNMSTRRKLLLSFACVVGFMIIIMLTALRGISVIRAYQDEIFTSEYVNTVNILETSALQNDIRLSLFMMLNAKERSDMDAAHQKIKESAKRLEDLFSTLLSTNKDEIEVYRRLEALNSVRMAFIHTRDAQIIPLIYAGKTDIAGKIATGVQAERFAKMRELTEDLKNYFKDEGGRHIGLSVQKSRETTVYFIVVGILAIIMSGAVAVYLNSLISRPMRELSDAAERVASGELSVRIPDEKRSDEVGMLARAFRNMIERLKAQTKDIAEAVNVLASSSNEIAATTAQLASGTEQTAVAVTETTTTADEVKQAATLSSQKAKHVSELAQSASDASQSGARLVLETIDGINHIREQVEYIAETIVRLSEHNQAIGDIIAAVDDLAEQSNLLAVNAAIEASRAGEHGKGFIVVAQEIKSMAEQSKQATKQVRSRLNDIQKASVAAVMATEKGTKAVEATVAQSSSTGKSMQEISRSISEAAQAVMQIAASNQQQLVGMDQVVMAMTNIKQATNQNAASTRQVEMTVKNLQDIGRRLKSMVDYYKV